jgi:hypothetical protein
MDEEGDDGMVHSLLSSLPKLLDADGPGEPVDSVSSIPALDAAEQNLRSSNPDHESAVHELDCSVLLPILKNDHDVKGWSAQETKLDRSSNVPCDAAGAVDIDHLSVNNDVGSTEKDGLASTGDPSAASENNMVTGSHPSIEFPSASENTWKPDGITLDNDAAENRSDSLSMPRSPSRDGKSSAPNGVDINNDEKVPFVNAVHPPTPTGLPQLGEDEQRNYSRHQRTIFLTDLLRQADALYAEFPPSHPDLHLSSIMGPQSVIFTWSESFSELPSDQEAEAMVQHPNLIVYPYVDIEEDESSESSEYEEEVKSRWRQKGKERLKAGAAKLKKKERKETALKRPGYPQGTVVAGAVLVVGVAVAIYGIKTRSGGSNGLFISFANTHGHASAQTQDWKHVGSWMSGALTMMGNKVVHAFDHLLVGNT